ncbi:MAG: potassium channel protein [Aureliella sp.]
MAKTSGQYDFDELVAPVMFYMSLAFLLIVAAILVLWIDVVVDPTQLEALAGEQDPELIEQELRFELGAAKAGTVCAWVLVIMWPVFWGEQLYHRLRLGSWKEFRRRQLYWWAFCLLPPLRLCAHRRGTEQEEVWFPVGGWHAVSRTLRKQLERAFSLPMMWIALLILPVLGAHLAFKESVINYPILRIALHFGTGLIWFAFTVEFIVMLSVAEKKLQYCKKHWLDLAIILLPLVSFLRTLRAVRATRLLKMGKLGQVSKLVRAYRLRGVAMRGFRALMVLEVIHRVMRVKPESRIQKLEQQYAEKELELCELREQIEELKQKLASEVRTPEGEELLEDLPDEVNGANQAERV